MHAAELSTITMETCAYKTFFFNVGEQIIIEQEIFLLHLFPLAAVKVAIQPLRLKFHYLRESDNLFMERV